MKEDLIGKLIRMNCNYAISSDGGSTMIESGSIGLILSEYYFTPRRELFTNNIVHAEKMFNIMFSSNTILQFGLSQFDVIE